MNLSSASSSLVGEIQNRKNAKIRNTKSNMNQTWCLWLCDASHAWETRAGMALNGAVGRPGGDHEDEDGGESDDGDSGGGDSDDGDNYGGDSGGNDCVLHCTGHWQDLVVGK